MSRINQLIIAFSFMLIFTACGNKDEAVLVSVRNTLPVERNTEVVELQLSQLGFSSANISGIMVQEQNSGAIVLSQLLDSDDDGIVDVLLFQPKLAANAELKYEVILTDSLVEQESKVFSRLAPERTDDYAWENDKVAFRTFGPAAQKMKEAGIVAKTKYGKEGGTLSSGIDCWLKKVDYPIIDKWYEKHTTGAGSYHEDTGDGLDNFHVGSSRGCGGTGVFIEDELYTSKNFTDYNTIANGPLRTEFILEFADWKAADASITEQKRIQLDLGSNLMKVTATVTGTETITVGLTLHENDGEVAIDTVNGWFSYWQPHADSELATAIVVNPENFKGYTKVVSEVKDKSQLLVHLNLVDGVVEYHTGFFWKRSAQFANKEAWEGYLLQIAQQQQTPLEVIVSQ